MNVKTILFLLGLVIPHSPIFNFPRKAALDTATATNGIGCSSTGAEYAGDAATF
jgi:hypothetical protein